MTRHLRFLCLLLWLGCASLPWAHASTRIDHYALELEPSFETRRFTGSLTLTLTVLKANADTLTLDAGALEVQAVRMGAAVDAVALPFERRGTYLRIRLPSGLRAQQALALRIDYTGAPTAGLSIDAEQRQVATAFSTSQWMPCMDDPSVRATLSLTLHMPDDLMAVANGEAAQPVPLGKARQRQTWQLNQPMPSYLYGFAMGPFRQVVGMAGKTELHYLGPTAFSAQDLQRIFVDSADMLSFYESRAGVAYPMARYTQVLLQGPAAQEMAGFSVMGVRYGTRVLADPQAIWLGAHEMAHQWWGNGLTNRAWTDFWLNEGIATFMTAAYLEHRFGKAEYERQIEAARSKYTELKAKGLDRALVFPDWDAPSAADRSLVYDKGALVMHELRQTLGEAKFWPALRHYTRKHWGQSVDTADFQRAMQESSGTDLAPFFRAWVYLEK